MGASKDESLASTTGTPLLSLRGVSKSFGGVRALVRVDLDVWPGEVVGLVGDNGAGKSTLIKAIAGSQPADTGEFFFEGRSVKIGSPKDSVALGIATVYQDLALCDNLDVVGNLFLGREMIGRFAGLSETIMERRTIDLLDTLSVTTIRNPRTPAASLSGGQRQSIAIARAMLGEPKVVLLDEPTAALGVAQTRQVLDLISRLKDRGPGIVVISHNLADIFAVTDRVEVLRLGEKVRSFKADGMRQEEVVAAITGARYAAPEQNGVDEREAR